MQEESSISPSRLNPELTQSIPRLLPGQLLARHVATLKAEDMTLCGWCGEPFQEGQDWMLDVYEQDGNSDTVLTVMGKPQVFRKTAVLMVHAKDCLVKVCTKAVHDFTEQVSISKRTALQMSDDEMRMIVWNHYRWAVRWISWHHQFIIGEPIQLVLASKRPHIVQAQLPSFVLDMTKSDYPGVVQAPMSLISKQFIEALYTRVYEFDLVYKSVTIQALFMSALCVALSMLHFFL